jgi:hypothetical protein
VFDSRKVGVNFATRLQNAGYGNSSYDRYTYYRLLSQLGTETGQEQPAGKLNLNYRNASNGVVVAGMETNFFPWTALEFFTNAADKLLQAYYPSAGENVELFNVPAPLSLTNIPVLVSNRFVYNASLHRLFQLAANLADSQTNYTGVRGADLPSVFRPQFRKDAKGDIYIAGWAEENDTVNLSLQLLDLTDPAARAVIPESTTPYNANVYGVSWVIGAKKNLPNFNEFMMKSVASVTRRLQFYRPSINVRPTRTNQMYQVGISNMFGFEAWNPYISNYNRSVRIFVENAMQIDLRYTNDLALDPRGGVAFTNLFVNTVTNIGINQWRGAGPSVQSPQRLSFQVPLFTNFIFKAEEIYRANQPGGPFFTRFTNVGSGLRAGFEDTGEFHIPQFNLAVSNRMRFIMVDTTVSPNRVIDYVCLNQLDGLRNMTAEVSEQNQALVNGSAVNIGANFWATNRVGGNTLRTPPLGLVNQIEASLGHIATGDNEWQNYGVNQYTGNLKRKEIDSFRAFMRLGPLYYPGTVNTNLLVQAPFTPTRRTSQTISWQANDPLVHYTKADLTFVGKGNGIEPELPTGPLISSNNLAQLNERFEPWREDGGYAETRMNLAVKDPGVRSPNDWNFPTNKFPNVGWLGRVHRGTPWQTVYLKSSDVSLSTWTNWSGNTFVRDANVNRPVADRVLFDVFTTALNDNATRGQLNVNQEGLAAWSAALGGLIGLTNTAAEAELNTLVVTNLVNPLIIRPAGTELDPTNSVVHRIWAGINRTRNDTNTFRGSFRRAGDVLATPELTVESPLLNRSTANQLERGIDDATYERLPQMLMGLLRGNEAPRFTIYAYGQALKPAPRSIVLSGTYAGLCTNYQITAEFATRTVVRMDVETNSAGRLEPRAVIESYNILGPE